MGGETWFMTEQSDPSLAPVRSRLLNRRQALAGIGGLGITALLTACGRDSKPGRGAAGSTSSTGTGDATTTPDASSRSGSPHRNGGHSAPAAPRE